MSIQTSSRHVRARKSLEQVDVGTNKSVRKFRNKSKNDGDRVVLRHTLSSKRLSMGINNTNEHVVLLQKGGSERDFATLNKILSLVQKDPQIMLANDAVHHLAPALLDKRNDIVKIVCVIFKYLSSCDDVEDFKVQGVVGVLVSILDGGDEDLSPLLLETLAFLTANEYLAVEIEPGHFDVIKKHLNQYPYLCSLIFLNISIHRTAETIIENNVVPALVPHVGTSSHKFILGSFAFTARTETGSTYLIENGILDLMFELLNTPSKLYAALVLMKMSNFELASKIITNDDTKIETLLEFITEQDTDIYEVTTDIFQNFCRIDNKNISLLYEKNLLFHFRKHITSINDHLIVRGILVCTRRMVLSDSRSSSYLANKDFHQVLVSLLDKYSSKSSLVVKETLKLILALLWDNKTIREEYLLISLTPYTLKSNSAMQQIALLCIVILYTEPVSIELINLPILEILYLELKKKYFSLVLNAILTITRKPAGCEYLLKTIIIKDLIELCSIPEGLTDPQLKFICAIAVNIIRQVEKSEFFSLEGSENFILNLLSYCDNEKLVAILTQELVDFDFFQQVIEKGIVIKEYHYAEVTELTFPYGYGQYSLERIFRDKSHSSESRSIKKMSNAYFFSGIAYGGSLNQEEELVDYYDTKNNPIIERGEFPLRIEIGDDIETDKLSHQLQIDRIQDIFKYKYAKSRHYNYIVTKNEKQFVVSVLQIESSSRNTTVDMLIIDDKRSLEKSHSTDEIWRTREIPLKLEAMIAEYFPGTEVYFVPHDQLDEDLISFENKHLQELQNMKIAVIYVQAGQSRPQEMFQNEPSQGFWDFVALLGEEVDISSHKGFKGDMFEGLTRYINWNNKEIIFHLAPLFKPEEHRRLIGNDIAVIFYHDDVCGTFDPTYLDELGGVPQIFAIVQPYRNCRFRFSCISRRNIKLFGPALSPTAYRDTELIETMYTKLFNGYQEAKHFSPPMNRLYRTPRGRALQEIIARYPKETKKEKKNRERSNTKIREKIRKVENENERLLCNVGVLNIRGISAYGNISFSINCLEQKYKSNSRSVDKPFVDIEFNEYYPIYLAGINLFNTDIEIVVYCKGEFFGEVILPIQTAIALGSGYVSIQTENSTMGEIQFDFNCSDSVFMKLSSS